MVGDYATEAFDSGAGAEVRDKAVHVVATVFKKFGWQPDPLVLWKQGLAFHKNCSRDHHDCPGKNVDRADVVSRVLKAMDAIHLDGITTSSGPAAAIRTPIAQSPNGPNAVIWVQATLNTLGAQPVLNVDGVMGPRTRAAIYAWQARSNLVANGALSPATVAALDRALAS